MGDARHDLGLAAERAVARWLRSAGWRVLAHRQRSRVGGEVDLIAIDPDDVLVAVEVRARRTARAGTGTETIGSRRAARIWATLAALAAERGERRELRVDVVIVTPMPGSAARWRVRRIPGVGEW